MRTSVIPASPGRLKQPSTFLIKEVLAKAPGRFFALHSEVEINQSMKSNRTEHRRECVC